MGSININFAEVESSFETMPAGRYPIIVEKVEVRESKSSEHNYLNWELTITEGEYEGRKLWMITSLSPKALFRLKDTFMAIGVIEGDEELDINWDDDVQITPQQGPLVIYPELSGVPATALVGIDTYEGKERNKVNEIVAPEDASTEKRPGATRSGTTASPRPTATSGARRALR